MRGTGHPGFVQLFRHPHPPRNRNAYTAAVAGTAAAVGAPASRPKEPPSRPPPEDIAGTEPTAGFSPSSSLAEAAAAAKKQGSTTEEGSKEALRSEAAGPYGAFDSAGRSIREGIGTDNPADAVTVERVGLESEGSSGGASIFGVAFDDYISEEGVRFPPTAAATAAVVAAAGGVESGAAAAGEARAKIEEDRRWR